MSRKAPKTALHRSFPSFRPLSSQPPPRPSNFARPSIFLAGSLFIASVGYLAFHQPVVSSIATRDSVAFDQKYGTREDFNKAIEELRDIFGAESVSTDPIVLGPYGYSENDYHPGMNPPTARG